jgi:glycosyltransferase involved in cell wall biosynthesis
MDQIDNSDAPLVSIILPVYNGAQYVGEAIDSCLSQTYRNIEIIVVNDGSNDGGKTENILLSYGPRIKYFKKENGGVSSALNFGVSKAKGNFVVWLSHDDKFDSRKIALEINALQNKKGQKTIVFCNNRFIDANGNTIHKKVKQILGKRIFTGPWFLFDFSLNGCSLLIPKQAALDNPFSTSLKYIPDTEAWYRMANDGYSFLYINKKLCYTRLHKNQVTKTSGDLFEKEYSMFIRQALETAKEKKDKKTIKHMLLGLSLRKERYPFEKELFAQVLAAAKKCHLITPPFFFHYEFLSLIGCIFK